MRDCMRTLEEIKEIIKQHEKELEEKFKVKEIALFGSYVRGDQDEKSDLDVLVKFREPVGFLFIHLADFLEELLGIEVDLVTKDAIKPNRWRYIKEDLIYV
jgi:predicted nucleotidyltransferase